MKNNRNSDLAKNTMILAFGQVIPKLIALVILPLLTTYLTKEDYGLYELTLSIAGFCIPFLSVQIQQAVFRFLLEPQNDVSKIITNSFLFLIIVFGISSIPIVLLWFLYKKNILLAILFFLCYFAEIMLNWISQITRGLGDNISYSFAYIIYSMVYVLCLLIIIGVNCTLTINSVISAMIFSYFISSIFLSIKLKINCFIKYRLFSKDVVFSLLSYSFPMVISSVSLWVVNLSDRFFITSYLGLEITAVYGVAYKIPNLFNSIYNIFNLSWTENTSKLSIKEKQSGYYSNFFSQFYHFMVGAMLILIIITPWLFKILINEQYIAAYRIISWLYLGVFFSSLVSFFGAIYVGEKRTTSVGISSAVGAIINILINLILMKKLGVIVAALSTIISFFLIFIYRAIDIKKYVLIKYNIIEIIFGIFIIIVFTVLNAHYHVVYSLILALLMIFYNYIFNRNFIFNIIKLLTKILKSKHL